MNSGSSLADAARDTAAALRFYATTRLCRFYATTRLRRFAYQHANYSTYNEQAAARQLPKLVFLGAPGVGKGTYAKILGLTWKIPHISTGELFREEIAANTPLGLRVKDVCARGELVSEPLVIEVCRKRLAEADCSLGWILDGFPRTLNQATMLRTLASPSLCVNLLLRRDILLKKLSGRRICEDCGLGFNVTEFSEGPYDLPPIPPPKDCGKCRGNPRLLKRADDSDMTIRRRLELYDEQVAPILRFYEEERKLLSYEMKKGLKDVPLLAAEIEAHLHR